MELGFSKLKLIHTFPYFDSLLHHLQPKIEMSIASLKVKQYVFSLHPHAHLVLPLKYSPYPSATSRPESL